MLTHLLQHLTTCIDPIHQINTLTLMAFFQTLLRLVEITHR